MNSGQVYDAIAWQFGVLGRDVEDPKAWFFLEQEALVGATHFDPRTKYGAAGLRVPSQGIQCEQGANKASIVAQELKHNQEAYTWRRKADGPEDDYRSELKRTRDESDELIDSATEALESKQARHVLFTINWEVK